jgi:hypothetical protein
MPAARKPRVVPKVDAEDTFDLVDLDAQSDEERSEFEHTAPLFTINGVTYEARTTFSAGEAMTYAKTARERGLDDAVSYAMVLAVGEDGWRALVTHPTLSNDTMSMLIDQVVMRVNPPVDTPKSSMQ